MAAIASRYARALVEVVLADKLDAAAITAQLTGLRSRGCRTATILRRVWDSPAISQEQKRSVLDALTRRLARPSRCATSWRC